MRGDVDVDALGDPVADGVATGREGERQLRVQALHTIGITDPAHAVALMKGLVRRVSGVHVFAHPGIILDRSDATVGLQAAHRPVQNPADQPVPRGERPALEIDRVVLKDGRLTGGAAHRDPVVGERLTAEQPTDRLTIPGGW